MVVRITAFLCGVTPSGNMSAFLDSIVCACGFVLLLMSALGFCTHWVALKWGGIKKRCAYVGAHRRGGDICGGMSLYDGVLFGPFDDFGDVAECESCYGVGTAVVNGDASGFGVVEGCTGECYVGHVACEFVDLAG